MSKALVRESALELLTRIGEQGGFSHVLLDREITKHEFSRQDGALLTEIVYGTLQRRDLLDFYLSPFIQKQKKLKPWVRWLLLMSLYQMTFLERVPDHAVFHEAVEISKRKGHKGIASLVNGVLRNVQRKGVRGTDQISDPLERISIETSHPRWLVKRWVDQYGEERAREMCEANNQHLPVSIRVQPLRISREDAIKQLSEDGFEVEASIFSSQGLIVHKGHILHHRLFREGYVTIQDQSSMLVAEMLDVEPGQMVLDACSAPGGKTTHIAEKMTDKGSIYAYDLHEKKAKLVREKAALLQLTSIKAGQADSRKLDHVHKKNSFDRIVLDAPCSGLGVLRGKPDIKYHKSEKDIYALRRIQDDLFRHVSTFLKENGKLVYSTCTVDRHENEEAVKTFLESHHEFQVDPEFFLELPEPLRSAPGISAYGLQLFPQDWDTDGFFLTRLVRRNEYTR